MTARPLAWLALLLFSLVASNSLVVCHGAHCQGAVEFVHASDGCCDHSESTHTACAHDHPHEHETAGEGELDEGTVAGADCGACNDTPVTLGVGPIPERLAPSVIEGLRFVAAAWMVPTAASRPAVQRHPATGPPRTSRWARLRATTVLLV